MRMTWTGEWVKENHCLWLKVHSILSNFLTGPLKMTIRSASMILYTILMTAITGIKKNGKGLFLSIHCKQTAVNNCVKNVSLNPMP